MRNAVPLRVKRRVQTAFARARYRLGLSEPTPAEAIIAPEFRHPIDGTRRSALIDRYRVLFPNAVRSELKECRRLMAHQFEFLGHVVEHGAKIEWLRDPVSGRNWGDGFSADIA